MNLVYATLMQVHALEQQLAAAQQELGQAQGRQQQQQQDHQQQTVQLQEAAHGTAALKDIIKSLEDRHHQVQCTRLLPDLQRLDTVAVHMLHACLQQMCCWHFVV